MTSILIASEIPPIREDDAGALRVGETRVLLELVLRAFQDGATPEAIVQRYPTLTLTDTYGVISYYLRHRGDIDQYLADREAQSEKTRTLVESQQRDISQLRTRLMRARGAELLRALADENFNADVLRGVRLRQPDLDIIDPPELEGIVMYVPL